MNNYYKKIVMTKRSLNISQYFCITFQTFSCKWIKIHIIILIYVFQKPLQTIPEKLGFDLYHLMLIETKISSHSHDRRFLKALLVACLGKVNIENNIINDITLDFVKGELKNYIGQTKTWK